MPAGTRAVTSAISAALTKKPPDEPGAVRDFARRLAAATTILLVLVIPALGLLFRCRLFTLIGRTRRFAILRLRALLLRLCRCTLRYA